MEVQQDQSPVAALPVSNEPDLEMRASRDQGLLILLKKADQHLRPTKSLLLLDFLVLNEHEPLRFEGFLVAICGQIQPFHAKFPQKHREPHTRSVD